MTHSFSRIRRSLLSAIALSIGVNFLPAADAIAANFALQDSPSASIDGSLSVTSTEGNNRIREGLRVTNQGTETDIDILFSFVWVLSPTLGPTGLSWDNQRDGWFTTDYDGNGNDLLVTLNDVTDGKTQFPLTQPCADASCFGGPLPPVTQAATDEVPILQLGSFQAGETKSFDASFNFAFEDNREGVLQFLPLLNTVTEAAPVPEPGSAIGFILIGLAATKLKRQSSNSPA